MNDQTKPMKEAMKDASGRPVFANKYGEYVGTFPRDDIVRRGNNQFIVYTFTGDGQECSEHEWSIEDEVHAIKFATELYGSEIDGEEVFEVEVHEVD